MSETLKIYHNPRCSKCRLTKQLVEDKGVSVNIVEYLKTPPTARELGKLLDMLHMQPRDLMRKHEAPYKELGLDDETLDRATLIEAMVANPILIERPIVVRGDRAVIGRPPENVLKLL